MAHDLHFNVLIITNTSWDELLARFKRVEALGFDGAAVGDHFVDWTNPPNPWFEPWTVLGAVARETTRIRLATFTLAEGFAPGLGLFLGGRDDAL